ncbi:chemotaxis protein CheW [Anoxybacillus rupiensis]|jgi:purine-binding chemotaxis protein CheW|uniref:Chemotaxis protein CheW n=1 Tax=Anoxybacteroides rupiense TaxID=311460 RepID=A0ABT5W2N3_9BACL|nr:MULTISPECIES: chemotaxis protein CheW [Anoxybacillus]KXG11178.1 Chemotaxis protein CheW [Anoxybacillus sp. P3H1B]MDE8562496.1 chemotaxis protein CheW [Anoxybacillus rupiensis]QHC04671.1 chemotaxis protein CheW [Anoxybacillus sp. PDR2]
MNKVVVFQLGNEQYAIPIEQVVSIEKMAAPTVIPQMPDYMLGVVRIRGELVPVLDMVKILYRHSYIQTEKTRLIVVQTEDLVVAFIADDAKEILDIPSEAMKKLNMLAYRQTPYFLGVANLPERLITLIDANRLFESLEGMQVIKERIKENQS